MEIELRVARSAEEREAIFRLRYGVYVEELGIYGHKADHERKLLTDEHDASARLLYAVADDEVIGTVRAHVGADAPLPEAYQSTYDTARFADLVPPEQMGVMTRFMMSRRHRGSLASLRLLGRVFQEQIDAGVQISFADCEPHLVSLYSGLGLQPYAPGYNSHDRDLLIPMGVIFGDRDHFERIQSPLLSSLRLPPPPPRLDELRARVRQQATVRPVDGSSRAMLWAMLHGALSGHDQERVPLLSGFSADETKLILRHGQIIDCQRGDCIVHRGQTNRTVFIVLDGAAAVRDGGRELASLGPGDVFGEISFLLGGRRIADVYATSDRVRVLSLSDRTLRGLLEGEGTSRTAARLLLNLSRSLALKLAHHTGRTAQTEASP